MFFYCKISSPSYDYHPGDGQDQNALGKHKKSGAVRDEWRKLSEPETRPDDHGHCFKKSQNNSYTYINKY